MWVSPNVPWSGVFDAFAPPSVLEKGWLLQALRPLQALNGLNSIASHPMFTNVLRHLPSETNTCAGKPVITNEHNERINELDYWSTKLRRDLKKLEIKKDVKLEKVWGSWKVSYTSCRKIEITLYHNKTLVFDLLLLFYTVQNRAEVQLCLCVTC